jgi:hypothetical protein
VYYYYYYYYNNKILSTLLLSHTFSPWYFSWTNSDLHRSGFKFQTALLSVLSVMFHIQLSFVVNLFNIFLVWLSNISSNLSLLFRWLQLLLVDYNHTFHVSHLLYFYTSSLAFYSCFCFLLLDISVSWQCHICQYAFFPVLFLIIKSGLLAVTFMSVCTAWFI